MIGAMVIGGDKFSGKPGDWTDVKTEIGKFEISVGVLCETCPAGFEFWNRIAGNRRTPCRSFDVHEW